MFEKLLFYSEYYLIISQIFNDLWAAVTTQLGYSLSPTKIQQRVGNAFLPTAFIDKWWANDKAVCPPTSKIKL